MYYLPFPVGLSTGILGPFRYTFLGNGLPLRLVEFFSNKVDFDLLQKYPMEES